MSSTHFITIFERYDQALHNNNDPEVGFDQVIQTVKDFCKQHETLLFTRPVLITLLKDRIITPLEMKTQHQYQRELKELTDHLNELLKRLHFNPISSSDPTPEKNHPLLKWYVSIPEDAQFELNMTPAQAKTINEALRAVISQLSQEEYSLRFIKEGQEKTLQLVKRESEWREHDQVVSTYTLPFSLHISYGEHHLVQDIILISKRVFAEGSQTKAKLCYSVAQMLLVVKKSSQSPIQAVLSHHIYRYPARGIVPIFSLAATHNRFYIYEAWRGTSLFDVIKERDLKALNQQLSVARDILYGLTYLHDLTYTHPTVDQNSFQMFHGDLSLNNVLIISNVFNAAGVLTDFGATDPHGLIRTVFWGSPEVTRLAYQKPVPVEALKDLNRQASDIWSAGLILSTLFTAKYLFNGNAATDDFIIKLSQEDIDFALERVNRVPRNPQDAQALNQLWNLVKQMVRVNPSERITAKQARDQFDAILKPYNI